MDFYEKTKYYNQDDAWVANAKEEGYVTIYDPDDPMNIKKNSMWITEKASSKKYLINFGKYKGSTMDELPDSYIEYLITPQKNTETGKIKQPDGILKACAINKLNKKTA